MTAIGNHRAGRDNDGIEVIGESEGSSFASSSPQTFPMVYENKITERRSHLRPYASSSSRIINKAGRCNVFATKLPNKEYRYIKDIGNTLLNTQWRWILISLCIANAVSYVLFAGVWMLIDTINGDENNSSSEYLPCVIGTKTFTGYLILSIETITTIGSGEIFPTECQSCWMLITVQALTGVAIEGALVTAVFVKMSRPYNKEPKRLFSRKAVVSMRDGVLCLLFRIRDVHGKHWAKTIVRAVLIKRRNSPEGESLPYHFEALKIEKHGLLFWPQEVVHQINEDSPMWTMSPYTSCKSRFEIVVILEGDSTTTGQPSQSQTSYTQKEICWGHRFVPCIQYDSKKHKYVVHDDKFNVITECDTPLCSAKKLKGLLNQVPTLWHHEVSLRAGIPLDTFKYDTGVDAPTVNKKFCDKTVETSEENVAACTGLYGKGNRKQDVISTSL